VNHPTTVALVVPNYAQLATMWYQKLATPIAASMPGLDELNDPSKTHLELFDTPEFQQLISDEVCIFMIVYVICGSVCVTYIPCFDRIDRPTLCSFCSSCMQFIRLSSAVKSYERPSIWLPIVQPFSQENQMLTPKMSLRRNAVVKAYQGKIDQLLKGAGNRVQYPK